MKVRKIMCLLLVALTAAITLVSCNNEVVQESASVSFVPSSAKALNQSGETTDVSVDVKDYYWEYYCKQVTSNDPVLLADLNIDQGINSPEWHAFENPSGSDGKGLGTIPDLIKNGFYVFGLRGFSINDKDDADFQIIWRGYQFVSSGSGDSRTVDQTKLQPVTLLAKNTLVTIDVYNIGTGRLFFNITAPNSGNWEESYYIEEKNASNEVVKTEIKTPKNRFVYKYQVLGGTDYVDGDVDNGEHYLMPEYMGTTTDTFCYYDSENPVLPTAGTYLFTIWQEFWDEDTTPYTGKIWSSTDNAWVSGQSQYKQSDERRQVVIVNIVPGVDTVIAGTLDSTSIETLDYEANKYSEDSAHGLMVRFNSPDAGAVDEMTVEAYRLLASKELSDVSKVADIADNLYVSAKFTTSEGSHIIRLDDPVTDKNSLANVTDADDEAYKNYDYNASDGTAAQGDSVIIHWTRPENTTETNLKFYINGDELAQNSDGTFVTDAAGYIKLKSEVAAGAERATSYVKYDKDKDWIIAETKPINSKSNNYKYFAYIITIKDNNVDDDRASAEESVCFTITNKYVAVTSITIMCNGEELPVVSGAGTDNEVRGITLSSTAKAQLVDNGWQAAMGSTPVIVYYEYDATAADNKGAIIPSDATAATYTAENQASAETYIAANEGTYVAEISAGSGDDAKTVSLLVESAGTGN